MLKVETLTSGKRILLYLNPYRLVLLSSQNCVVRLVNEFSYFVMIFEPVLMFRFCFFCVCCDDSKFWTERLKFKLLCFQFSSFVKDKRWNHCGKWFAKLDFLSRCLLLIFQIYNVFCCFNYLFFYKKLSFVRTSLSNAIFSSFFLLCVSVCVCH